MIGFIKLYTLSGLVILSQAAQADITTIRTWEHIHPDFGRKPSEMVEGPNNLLHHMADYYTWESVDKNTPCIDSLDGANVLLCGPIKSKMSQSSLKFYREILQSPSKFLAQHNLWFGNNTLKAIIVDSHIRQPEFVLSGGDEEDPRRLSVKIPFWFTHQDFKEWAKDNGSKMFVELMEKHIHQVMLFEPGWKTNINPNHTLVMRSNCQLTLANSQKIEFTPRLRSTLLEIDDVTERGKVDAFGRRQGIWHRTNRMDGLSITEQYQDNNRHGLYEVRSLEGDLLLEGQYHHDQRQGTFTKYLPKEIETPFNFGPFGQFNSGSAEYHNDQLHGRVEFTLELTTKELDEYGNPKPPIIIKTVTHYKDGKKHGKHEKAEDGRISAKGNYNDGNKDGYWITGYMVRTSYYEAHIDYIDGVEQGAWREFVTFNGHRYQYYGDYRKDGGMHGWQTIYCKNGKVRQKFLFSNGVFVPGTYKYYHCNGNLQTAHYLDENKKAIGPFTEYDSQGNVLQKGNARIDSLGRNVFTGKVRQKDGSFVFEENRNRIFF